MIGSPDLAVTIGSRFSEVMLKDLLVPIWFETGSSGWLVLWIIERVLRGPANGIRIMSDVVVCMVRKWCLPRSKLSHVMRRDGEWQKEGFGEANTLCRVNEL